MKGVFFTYLLTAYGCVAGIFWPVYGAFAYFALSILKPRALWFWSVPFREYTLWVGTCTLIGWGLSGFGRRDHLSFMKLALVCIVGFVGWQWLSLIMHGRWNDPWLRYHCETISKDMLMIIVVLTLVTSFKHLRIFTYVVIMATGYLAYEMNYAYVIQNWNRLWIREFAGVDNNGMAMVFAMTVPLMIAVGAFEKDWRLKLLAWAWIPFNIHAVQFSFSRTGMLGLFTCIPFVAVLLPRKLRTASMLAVVTAGGLWMAGPSVRDRFSSIFLDREQLDASARSRYVTWAAGWKCMNENPFLGVGPRCFNRVSRDYGLSGGKSIHNLFLQIGADLGFPGMFLLIGIYAGTMIALLWNRRLRSGYSPWYPYWSGGIVAGLATSVICSQFIGMERVEMPYMLCAIGLAAVKVALMEQASPEMRMKEAAADVILPEEAPVKALPAT